MTATPLRAVVGQRQSMLELYRDDGPLARVLGTALGARVGAPAFLLVGAAALPLLTVLVLDGDGAPRAAVAAVLAWLVLAGALSHGRAHRDRFAWAVPALLRLVEYAGLLWFATLAGPAAVPAAFALLAALTFRHYDVVYRLRYQGVAPPLWLGLVAGGWEGRLLVAFALLSAGALRAGMFVAAALLAILFVSESAVGWARFSRMQRPPPYADDDEVQEGE
jgi:hypothetical protein